MEGGRQADVVGGEGCAITSMSSRTAVSMPTLMPALAITTSGTPWAGDAGRPASTMLSVWATSAL
jgi:hypothetical protein